MTPNNQSSILIRWMFGRALRIRAGSGHCSFGVSKLTLGSRLSSVWFRDHVGIKKREMNGGIFPWDATISLGAAQAVALRKDSVLQALLRTARFKIRFRIKLGLKMRTKFMTNKNRYSGILFFLID